MGKKKNPGTDGAVRGAGQKANGVNYGPSRLSAQFGVKCRAAQRHASEQASRVAGVVCLLAKEEGFVSVGDGEYRKLCPCCGTAVVLSEAPLSGIGGHVNSTTLRGQRGSRCPDAMELVDELSERLHALLLLAERRGRAK
jgi:hypothetical protein